MQIIAHARKFGGILRKRYILFRRELDRTLPVLYTRLLLFSRFKPLTSEKVPLVLFASYDPGFSVDKHWMGHVESLVGKYLELKYSVRCIFYVTNSASLRWTVYKAFRFTEFVSKEDFSWQLGHAPTEFAELVNRDLAAFNALLVDNVPLGRLTLASARRNLRKSHIESPSDWEIVEQKFEESLYQLHLAEQILNKIRPAIVITNHATYVEQGGVMFHTALARGFKTLCTQTWSPKVFHIRRYSLDERMEHIFGLSKQAWDALKHDPCRHEYLQHISDFLKKRMAGEHQMLPQAPQIGIKNQSMSAESITFPNDDPIVGVFTHLPWDASGAFYHDLFPSLYEWIRFTAQVAAENKHVNWIFRIHPAEKLRGSAEDTAKAIREVLPKDASHIKIIDSEVPISSYALIPKLSVAVTVRGTLAIEIPCSGIPVICAGSGPTSVASYNAFPSSVEEYRQTLLNVHDHPALSLAQLEEARLYAYGFFLHNAQWIECVDNFIELSAMRQVTPEKIMNDKTLKRVAEKIFGNESH